MILPDLKTGALWVLGIVLAGALAAAGYQRMAAQGLRADLATEQADRARENEARSRAALRYMENVAAAQLAHAATQQEIASALAEKTRDLDRVRRRNGELDGRLQRIETALAAALSGAGDRPGAVAGERPGDRSDAIDRALAEGGRILVRYGAVVGQLRAAVAQRDGEVATLKDVIDNDRRAISAAGEAAASAGETKQPR